MKIEFLGHAGFLVSVNNQQILFDPWLIPSTFENPILKSVIGEHKTIDFLIPESVRSYTDIHPDFIFVSHYHTHHSPFTEIDHWLQTSEKSIHFMGPIPYLNKKNCVDEIVNKYKKHTFHFIENDTQLNIGVFNFNIFLHTARGHLGVQLYAEKHSFMHIADACVSRNSQDRRLDLVWHKHKNRAPDFLALTVGACSSKGFDRDQNPIIIENTFMSPVEAAKLIQMIQPKSAGIMGVFNASIWKNRKEYSISYAETENYFRWATQHLAPQTTVFNLRPGSVIEKNNNRMQQYFEYIGTANKASSEKESLSFPMDD